MKKVKTESRLPVRLRTIDCGSCQIWVECASFDAGSWKLPREAQPRSQGFSLLNWVGGKRGSLLFLRPLTSLNQVACSLRGRRRLNWGEGELDEFAQSVESVLLARRGKRGAPAPRSLHLCPIANSLNSRSPAPPFSAPATQAKPEILLEWRRKNTKKMENGVVPF